MRKHFLLTFILYLLLLNSNAQVIGWNQPASPPPYGMFRIGTSAAGVETGRSVCIDVSGNIYVYGMFTGTADFDPSAASSTATANGTSSDLFIAKYNSAGAFQWVARGGVTNSGDNSTGNFGSIKTDGTNVYVVGSLAVSSNSATFTPAAGGCTCTEASNGITTRGFVGKLDCATGTWQWMNSFGGIGTTQNSGQGLCLDASSNVYISGQCNGSFTLGALPTIAVADAQVFFAKLTPAGVWQWATTAGGTGGDGAGQSGSGITYNTNLNRLVSSGSYNSTSTTFGSIALAASSSNDIFLTELNPSTGAFLSAFSLGGIGAADECGGIVYDPYTTDVFLAGQMSGALSLPGTGALAQASASNDVFVARFTPNAMPANGVFSWAKSFGLAGLDRAYDIATNANGNIYIAGWFSGSGTINFGSEPKTQVSSTGTGNEIFVASLDVAGNGNWAVQGSENGLLVDQARGICATQNTSGTVYATGQFNTGTVSWTPASLGNTISLTNAGTSDVWVGKIYGPTPTIIVTGTTTAFSTCAGIASSSQNFTVSAVNLTANITITAPTGFEVSTTAGSGYGTSVTLTQASGTVATTTIYTRLSTIATGSPSGNIVCTSTGATTKNVAVASTVNALPTLTQSASPAICAGASSFSIPYTATTNTPTTYSISGAGITSVTNTTLPATPITVNLSSAASGTSYSYTLTVSNANTCVSNNINGTVIVNTTTLPTTTQTATQSITNNFITSVGCALIANVLPNGGAPVTGTVEAKVWIETTQPVQFVKRHYEINPATNAANATAKVTLYFSDAEFNSFNTQTPAPALLLPISTDAPATITARKANMLIEKRAGTGDVNGTLNSYTGAISTIDPADADIVWNAAVSRWEVSFNVVGFSGFWLKPQLGILPLQLASFTGTKTNNGNLLQWKTSSEINTKTVEIERQWASSSSLWAIISTQASVGNGANSYSYTDVDKLSGTVFYRLKMIDVDGRFTHSNIIKLSNQLTNQSTFYPNPITTTATLEIGDRKLLNTQATITDANGRNIKTILIKNNFEIIDLSTIVGGLYILKLANGEALKMIRK